MRRANLALRLAPCLLLVGIFALFEILSPGFVCGRNIQNIAREASFIGIVAVGMTFVMLAAGIDLSAGSTMYLSAAVAGLLIRDLGVPVPLAVAACLAIGLLCGAMNAALVTRLNLLPFVATLGTMVAGRGLAWFFTGSEEVKFPASVERMGSLVVLEVVPFPVVIFAAVVLSAHLFLTRTPCGRQIYAVGNDREAAERAGIPTRSVLAAAYLTSGVLAALGGFVSVAQLGNVTPKFGKGKEFEAIAVAVLGGTSLFGGVGTVFPGTLVGALLIPTASAGLVFTQTNLYLRPILEAAIIFLAVFLDGLRSRQLEKLGRRPIRVEETGS